VAIKLGLTSLDDELTEQERVRLAARCDGRVVNRLKPRNGPYRTPRFRYGAIKQCALRSDVVIVGISNGRIPWPMGRQSAP
jgi:hypothetical protein